MNQINKKRFIQGAVASAIFALSVPALALKTDTQQPMTINSVKQSLDSAKNITTFTDDVIFKQGSIDIRANKVVITRSTNDPNKIVVEAYGTPVTFYQLQDDGKPIKGHATKARYEVDKKLLTLTGDAYLEQLDSNIKGDRITYIVPTQQMEAFSDKGKRVTTVLLPSQLQEKGPAANNGKGK
ncbi:lipopolysaccharide ABC transporter substrate-binding protein LptA [Providencia burhodogranariea]|uniref:Lipopolysaccharide export system protein LptA n=1 Tax=Providencia burhodogranariea DSM 19968 TaxID=1141662 RepID=K8WGE7_9GAMM|nr:lipopolysaccharide ABC transporter substrate-binding protein LptA [Providencia burhodogranariea]EKT59629.1 lipopolysaccharide transport periplasmic protein LptA [Providencia burhodogranariea DSM 19968]